MQIICTNHQLAPSKPIEQAEGVQVFLAKSDKAQGDACSVLLNIDNIDSEGELVLYTGNSLEIAVAKRLGEVCRKTDADVGVLTGKTGGQVQTENNSSCRLRMIANGFTANGYQYQDYIYFRQAVFFFEAAKAMIRKRSTYEEKYSVLFTVNETILQQLKAIRVDFGALQEQCP